MTATIDISPFSPSSKKEQLEISSELQILEDGQNAPSSKHGMFRILHPDKGDERVVWDSGSLSEINAAKQLFGDLIKKGLTPYRVGINGKASSEVMDEFDPHAEEVIFLPTNLVAGG